MEVDSFGSITVPPGPLKVPDSTSGLLSNTFSTVIVVGCTTALVSSSHDVRIKAAVDSAARVFEIIVLICVVFIGSHKPTQRRSHRCCGIITKVSQRPSDVFFNHFCFCYEHAESIDH